MSMCVSMCVSMCICRWYAGDVGWTRGWSMSMSMCVYVCVFAGGMLEMLGGHAGGQTETVVEAALCPALQYDQVTRLFDIVPGLDTCHYDHTTGLRLVSYLLIYLLMYTSYSPRIYTASQKKTSPFLYLL